MRQRLFGGASCVRQTTSHLVEAPQLDPPPGVVGVQGLRRLIERNHLGRPHLASILAVLGERGNLTPASGDRLGLGLLNCDQGVEGSGAIPRGIALQGFTLARVRGVSDRGDLPSVLRDLGSELPVAGGDFVHQALARRRDLGELALRRLTSALLNAQATVLGPQLGEEPLFPLIGDSLHRRDGRRPVEHQALDERPVLSREVGRGDLALDRSWQYTARDQSQNEDRKPHLRSPRPGLKQASQK